ncbi:hypothetical protein AB0N81_13290 [Streptomyces sp. NPDC093510]|uniref:hypothetical protein n=1 Tax=Streptomyces sp. NPDC093510 TaxID=3155199 RepID=UPI003415B90B
MVDAVRAQEKGIGRAMKASKEAVLGVLAALQVRGETDVGAWRRAQTDKAVRFVEKAGALPGIDAALVADPTGLPFPLVRLGVDPVRAGQDAASLARARLSALLPDE